MAAAGVEAGVREGGIPRWPPLGEPRSPPRPPIHTLAHWRPAGDSARYPLPGGFPEGGSIQASRIAWYQARRKAATPGRARQQGRREGWRRKMAAAAVQALSGAARRRRRRVAQVGPPAKAPGWRPRNWRKCAPYHAAWASTSRRVARTAACSTTAAGTKAVGRPAARARRTQTWCLPVGTPLGDG